MTAPKVCMGCFSEWGDYEKCPKCGWEIHSGETETPAAVLEQRYLLGKVFYEKDGMKIWRVYDNDLGISCFMLMQEEDAMDELESVAEKLSDSRQKKSFSVKVLSLKNVKKRMALFFTMEDYYLSTEKFEELLKPCEVRKTPLIREISYEKSSEKMEQVLPEGTLLDKRYKIIGCIGIGGFGITYLCEDVRLHRNVAVKEYFPFNWVERDEEYVLVKKSGYLKPYRVGMKAFHKEAKMMALFIHVKNIVTIYDVFEANDTVYIAMDYLSGTSIGREMRLRQYKPYNPEETAEIILPILKALDKMHEKRIVHSDISPGNIMRSTEGELYLIDLGAAKFNLESQPIQGTAFLKPDYAAPEQYRTAKTGIPQDEGAWTDIYALGATIYYLMTGKKPADAVSRLDSGKTNLSFSVKDKLRISKKWMSLINHCMELDHHKRFDSVNELEKEIRCLVNKEEYDLSSETE
jgi:hypothetical protein